jgi:hypothetical protein
MDQLLALLGDPRLLGMALCLGAIGLLRRINLMG